MLFKLKPIIYSLIFALSLSTLLLREGIYFKLIIFLIFFSVVVIWPLARKLRFLAIPFFLSIGSANLLFLIDSMEEKVVFIFIAAVVYYFALMGAYRLKFYDCDQTAQGMVNLATLATAFFWFSSNYGWFLNFQVENWILIVGFFISVFLITLPSLQICSVSQKNFWKTNRKREKGERRKNSGKNKVKFSKLKKSAFFLYEKKIITFISLCISLIVAEAVWSFYFWPFSYLTVGTMSLIVYYIFWNWSRNFLLGSLTKKQLLWIPPFPCCLFWLCF